MVTLSPAAWIGNAAAVLCGRWGDVTRRAREAGCSRQTVYQHAEKVQAALDCPATDPLLSDEVRQLRRENEQLWEWLGETVEFPPPRREEFAATASAMGLSLTQITVLLGVVLGDDGPSRSSVGRWVETACRKATEVLRVLDQACRGLVVSLCLDEIFFHRQPVLVGVEPASMAWVIGERAADRSGQTWFEALRPWDSLESAVADGGTGMQSGLKQLDALRQQQGSVPLDVGLDVFHTKKEALPVIIRKWKSAESLWEEAEAADRAVERSRKRGEHAGPAAARARAAWNKAERAFHRADRLEAVWKRAEAALSVFRSDGSLNDRTTAEAELAAVVEELPGNEWAKVRRMLVDPRTLTFLDRMHRQLAEVEPNESLRRELAHLWWLRRQRRPNTDNPLLQSCILVQQVLCERLGLKWRESYRKVVGVIRQVVRASSLVECMNSVIRMHQARHRQVSQPMLDLKRLYWNCRPFREGHRRGRSPYSILGLPTSPTNWWALLQTDPAQLAKKLSTT
jgi:hypothetical protein